MKRKLFFASVAVATVLASCTKEEIVNVDNQMQELGNRPMVEAPVFTLGNAGTKMTTNGVYAGVKWEAGDGFGAAVMDTYNPAGTTFANTFTIVDYINSNVLFSTQDGTSFTAEASMPEGNHLFYAPFNKENISRKALATQLPLEQVVANPSSNAAAPSNDIIKAFYEDGTNPVFVAYEKIYGEAKTSLDIQMRHIYSLPLVTLKLGDKVVVIDENGVRNQVEVEENGKKVKKDVYESEITIDKIEFVNEMQWKGSIVNKNIATLLAKDKDGNIVWDAVKYENAKTSDIVKFDALDPDEEENIVVKFDGGQKLTADENGYFFMVLPGNAYNAASLRIKVYATINGKQYVSIANLDPAKDVRLLPGLFYSADEYNADGTMKNSKGTSMTYVVDGDFSATDDPAAITGYTAISNYNELVSFVTNVAYRGEALVEVEKAWAENELSKESGCKYDPRKHFVVTATKNAPIVLDDAFVAAFEKACVISNANASMSFLARTADNINLVWGDFTWNDETRGLFSFKGGNVYAKGNVLYEAEKTKGGTIYTLDGATINLKGDGPVSVVNNANAIVNVNSKGEHNVTSTAGTVNVLVSTKATIVNGLADNKDHTALVSKSTLNIADGVTMETPVANNSLVTTKKGVATTHYAEATVNAAVVTIVNNGNIMVNSDKAKLTVEGAGSVDNTLGGVVYNTGNTVYATVSTFKGLETKYDELCGLNKLVVTGSVQTDLKLAGINTIDFNAGSSLAMGSATWNWAGKKININADVTWTGRDASVSKIIVDLGAINVTGNYNFNVVDIDMPGYQPVVANSTELADAIAAGETRVVLSEGTYDLDLYSQTARESLTIKGTKNSVVRFADKQVRLELFENVVIENCVFDAVMAGKTWGMLVFSTGKADGKYTVRNCTFKGVTPGTQGIYINENNSGAVYNIENCTFDGDFGGEGAVTIQCNTGAKSTVNVKGCTFTNIPSTSHKVCLVKGSDGVISTDLTLNTDLNASDIYKKN